MFYSAQILSKKGPLGSVWIASWSQRSLKRQEVFSCSLPAAVDSIINPEAPLALRLSGQLLLGLVRLYLRKLQFLEEDAGLALRGLARNAAAGGGTGMQLDLPDGGVAPEVAITLQDGGYDPMAQFVGAELFPSFESSLFGEGDIGLQGGGRYGAPGASVTVAQDISELFGSHWTPMGEEERYDVDGADTERRFSTELERLRSQGVEAPHDRTDMFFGGQADAFSPVLMDDEVMAVPPEDLFAGPAPTPGKTPVSESGRAPLPGLSDMRITPPSLPAAGGPDDLLPDIRGGGAGATTTTSAGTFGGGGFSMTDYGELPPPLPMEAEEPEEAAVAAAAAGATPGRQQAGRRRQRPAHRRRPQVDAHSDGRPATTQPSDEIRKLLADRKPLMTRRGLRARKQRPALPPAPFDVVAQSEAARESEMYRPSAFTYLSSELMQLFSRNHTLPGQAAADASPHRRRRSSRGAAAAAEEAAAAAATADVAVEQLGQEGVDLQPPGSLGLSAGYTAGDGAASMFSGGTSDFAPLSVGGLDEEFIETADTQQQEHDLVAAPFPAGPGRPEEEEGPAAERRGRLPLAPLSGSGESLVELGSIGPEDSSAVRSGGSSGAAQQTSFTKNTALVLEHLRHEFAPSAGSKRRHPSHGNLAADMSTLSLDGLLQARGAGGAARGRLDAARWFYECLVLRNTGFVELGQEEPYGDIQVRPQNMFFSH